MLLSGKRKESYIIVVLCYYVLQSLIICQGVPQASSFYPTYYIFQNLIWSVFTIWLLVMVIYYFNSWLPTIIG